MSAAADRVHDVVAIGLGPANLGLACLADPLDLDLVVLERKPRFDWHPGMMLPTAHLQTPFLADLVTLADPTSRFSFLAYLKDTGRLYSFYIREDFFVLRSEYVAYCRWAAERARGIELDRDVRAVAFDEAEGAYIVESVDAAGAAHVHRGRNLVVGVGTPPWLPEAVRDLPGVVHSSGYLGAKAALQERDAITVVGSGQSAAEIYRDLLEDVDSRGYRLDWITRSPRFFPLEYTRLTLEMTSPEYSDHFFGLPADARDVLLREQRNLYKGIDSELIDEIFQTLYRKRLAFDALRAEGRLAAGGDAGSRRADPAADERGGRVVARDARRRRGPRAAARRDGRRARLADGRGDHGERIRRTGPADPRRPRRPRAPRRAGPPRRGARAHGRRRRHALRAERGGAHARLRRARPRHDRAPQLADPARHHGPRGLRGGGADRVPGVRPAGRLALGGIGGARVSAPVTAPAPAVARSAAERGYPLAMRPLDPDADAALVHAWVTAPRARFWQMEHATLDDVSAEYAAIAADPGREAWIGLHAGAPAFLVEAYDPPTTPSARTWIRAPATAACTCSSPRRRATRCPGSRPRSCGTSSRTSSGTRPWSASSSSRTCVTRGSSA